MSQREMGRAVLCRDPLALGDDLAPGIAQLDGQAGGNFLNFQMGQIDGDLQLVFAGNHGHPLGGKRLGLGLTGGLSQEDKSQPNQASAQDPNAEQRG
jgi:hypothetical protein